ncbi:restriction endonuclease subunit S [Nonlabens sp. Asnod2-A12]|uniref:restriction endonuclease subunit S n=1 Tax=Nonlabens sp. Asnod2-A12 TaxID=3160578 RepID=UPI003864E845
MKSNYKRLGDFIEEINIRNRDLEVDLLLGVSIRKVLMPSIANTIGSDMSKYKIISKNQFAYGPITSRNGDKISIALLQDYEKALLSQAYKVFQIIDSTQLLPEYLMMWFRRPEFDRYARYMSHGSTREAFDWQELCEVEIPVPSLEKQQEIVADYNTVQERIRINEQLNTALEETAQALYKRWFVDFEFPTNVSSSESRERLSNDKALPALGYKSSGGAMVYNEELDMKIPLGWEVRDYETSFNFTTGKLNSNAAIENGNFPFFTCSSETYLTDTYSFDCEALILAGNNASAVYPFKYFKGKFDAYQRTYIITPKDKQISIQQGYYEILSQLEGFKGSSSGTATKFLTMKILNSLKLLVATDVVSNNFQILCQPMFSNFLELAVENKQLNSFSVLLLSKMATVVDDKRLMN